MVTVLRASGSLPTDLTPQPTIGELAQLVAGSGISATLEADLPDDVSPPVQRAVYRTVQEALTNVRKHAPARRRRRAGVGGERRYSGHRHEYSANPADARAAGLRARPAGPA
ncbi:sensor histidine kinase [Fodinicola feengrottensis]|uniref:hypothetical protein n=1 Tax=Fodinicola feengrottensis TaxID=435914 RepID=UPI00244305F9|nr:hypothetical protein [Fodinicola feengrottensis]